jgi:glycosyltransferase 2 family protein
LKKNLIQILKYVFFISLGLLLLYLAFRNIDFNSIKDGLLEANYSWVLLSFSFSILAFISRARRWKLLINPLGYNPSFRNSFLAMMTGYLANIAFPRLGEVTRCVALGKKEKIPVDKLVGTVIVERTIDFLSLLVIMVIMLFISSDTINFYLKNNIIYPAHQKLVSIFGFTFIFWILIIVLISISVLLFIKFREKLADIKLFARIFHFSKGIIEGVKTILRLEKKEEFLFHTLFIWLNYALMTWVIVFTLKSTSGLTFTDGIFLLILGSLAFSAPVQSGIGVFHLIISRGLNTVFGISLVDGLVYATISHETQLLLVIFIGTISSMILFNKPNTKSLL